METLRIHSKKQYCKTQVEIQNKLFSKIRHTCFPTLRKSNRQEKKVSLKAFITLGVEGIHTQTSPPKQEGGLQQFDMVLAPMYVTEGL